MRGWPLKPKTMKTLLLVRHAKASRDDPSLDDRDRPLTERGPLDAPTMGKRLAKRGVKLDVLLASPAARARATAELIADELGYKRSRVAFDERIYDAEPESLLEIACGLDDALSTVMLVGHNPGFSEMAQIFTDEIGDLPTCGIAELRFSVAHWAALDAGTLASFTLDYPKKDA
jgi:phosphohistidine phosphatase